MGVYSESIHWAVTVTYPWLARRIRVGVSKWKREEIRPCSDQCYLVAGSFLCPGDPATRFFVQQLPRWSMDDGRCSLDLHRQLTPKFFTFFAVLRKNAVWTFESCLISSDKIISFEDIFEYFLLKFADDLDLAANEIIWKIWGKMSTNFSVKSYFIKENLATSEGTYGVFP